MIDVVEMECDMHPIKKTTTTNVQCIKVAKHYTNTTPTVYQHYTIHTTFHVVCTALNIKGNSVLHEHTTGAMYSHTAEETTVAGAVLDE